MTLVAALGDLTRFENSHQLMNYPGLIPSEYASGERRRQGAMTKATNIHARRALVEGAWAYRYPAKVTGAATYSAEWRSSPSRSKTSVGKPKYGCASAFDARWPAAHTPTTWSSPLPGNWRACYGLLLKRCR